MLPRVMDFSLFMSVFFSLTVHVLSSAYIFMSGLNRLHMDLWRHPAKPNSYFSIIQLCIYMYDATCYVH